MIAIRLTMGPPGVEDSSSYSFILYNAGRESWHLGDSGPARAHQEYVG
jgi:hypothetical protein